MSWSVMIHVIEMPAVPELWSSWSLPCFFLHLVSLILTRLETCKLSQSSDALMQRFITGLSALIRGSQSFSLAWTLSQQFPSLTTLRPWDRWLISFIADMSGRKCGWISSENRICRQTSWQTWWQSSTTWRTAAIWCLQRPWPWGRWKVRGWRVVTCSWLMKTSVTSRHKCCAVISNSKVCIWGETQVINQCQHPSEICTTKTGSYFHKIICTFASKLNTCRLPIAGRSIWI